MFINFKGEEIQLSFSALFIRKMDKALGLKVEGAELGRGLSFLIPNLQDADEGTIAEVLVNATPNNRHGINSIDDAFEVIDEIIVKGEEEGKEDALQDFADKLLEELGKLPTIRRRIKLQEKQEQAK